MPPKTHQKLQQTLFEETSSLTSGIVSHYAKLIPKHNTPSMMTINTYSAKVYSQFFKQLNLVSMLATFGVVLGAAYMLWLIKRVIFGNTNNNEIKNLKDINNLETLMLGVLGVLVIFLGFYPAPLLDTINISVNNLISNYEIAIQNSGIN